MATSAATASSPASAGAACCDSAATTGSSSSSASSEHHDLVSPRSEAAVLLGGGDEARSRSSAECASSRGTENESAAPAPAPRPSLLRQRSVGAVAALREQLRGRGEALWRASRAAARRYSLRRGSGGAADAGVCIILPSPTIPRTALPAPPARRPEEEDDDDISTHTAEEDDATLLSRFLWCAACQPAVARPVLPRRRRSWSGGNPRGAGAAATSMSPGQPRTPSPRRCVRALSQPSSPPLTLADDPTVQESIECVFRSGGGPRSGRRRRPQSLDMSDDDGAYFRSEPWLRQLQDEEDLAASSRSEPGLGGFDSHGDFYYYALGTDQLPPAAAAASPPSALHRHRPSGVLHPPSGVAGWTGRHARQELDLALRKQTQALRRPQSAARAASASPPKSPLGEEEKNEESATASAAAVGAGSLPLDARAWPQYPLLLRANAATRVRGVRYSDNHRPGGADAGGNDKDGAPNYLWTPDSPQSWLQLLHRDWDQSGLAKHVGFAEAASASDSGIHMILPVNNGNEPPGRALVTDFETDLFEGTLMLRIRYTEGTTPDAYDDNKGYFHGVHRRYQAVVRGRFKKALPWTDLLTGFYLNRPCGKLPPKFIIRSALKVISFFAPQLQAQVNGPHPQILTPLGSTPQCISVHEIPDDDGDATYNRSLGLMDGELAEPTQEQHTLLREACADPSSMHRARFRKRNFDRLFSAKRPATAQPDPSAAVAGSKDGPVRDGATFYTDPSRVYTFEFLQHLFDFEAFSVELGSVLGSIPLAPILHGQPLQVMACTSTIGYLWGFELWHATLLEDLRQQMEDEKQAKGAGTSSGSSVNSQGLL